MQFYILICIAIVKKNHGYKDANHDNQSVKSFDWIVLMINRYLLVRFIYKKLNFRHKMDSSNLEIVLDVHSMKREITRVLKVIYFIDI